MLSWVSKAKAFLKGYIKPNSFDLCIANFTIPGGEVGLFLKKQFGLPYIVISHGHDIPWFFPSQMFFYHSITFFWIKKICEKSSGIFVQSETMRDNAVRFLGRSKTPIYKVFNGCNIDQFLPNYSKRSNVFKILFVGRLVKQKDPITFLKAIKVLSDRRIPFTATVIGDGPMRNIVENYISKNQLNDIVKVIGWVDKNKMLDEYQSSSLLVSTSLDEGMSIALLEALSSGLYVIATPASGNREMIGEAVNGEIVEFKEYIKLADKIEDFYKQKFQKGYLVPDEFMDKFRDKYSWKNIVNEYDKLLKSLF
jgi:glycosyltransferase involved in cell wall biosynthesis